MLIQITMCSSSNSISSSCFHEVRPLSYASEPSLSSNFETTSAPFPSIAVSSSLNPKQFSRKRNRFFGRYHNRRSNNTAYDRFRSGPIDSHVPLGLLGPSPESEDQKSVDSPETVPVLLPARPDDPLGLLDADQSKPPKLRLYHTFKHPTRARHTSLSIDPSDESIEAVPEEHSTNERSQSYGHYRRRRSRPPEDSSPISPPQKRARPTTQREMSSTSRSGNHFRTPTNTVPNANRRLDKSLSTSSSTAIDAPAFTLPHSTESHAIENPTSEHRPSEEWVNPLSRKLPSRVPFKSVTFGSEPSASTASTSQHPSSSGRPRVFREQFQFGNYKHYYGYRNAAGARDPRLEALAPLAESLFTGKQVLDVGCNAGDVTLAIAREWQPACIVGTDIDEALIRRARSNVVRLVSSEDKETRPRRTGTDSGSASSLQSGNAPSARTIAHESTSVSASTSASASSSASASESWPRSFATNLGAPRCFSLLEHCLGRLKTSCSASTDRSSPSPTPTPSPASTPIPLATAAAVSSSCPVSTWSANAGRFPSNVRFEFGNFVPQSDEALERVQAARFDTVLALSVTKWMQLNWGDAGLKRAFRRMHRQLRPGGALVLEPQPFKNYRRRKNLSVRMSSSLLSTLIHYSFYDINIFYSIYEESAVKHTYCRV